MVLAADARNAEVLFPYLNGEDLNSRPDSSASRWVIDFNERTEAEAATYELPYRRLLEKVKPERQRRKQDGSFKLRHPMPERWWQYGEKRPALRRAIASLTEVLVITIVSKTVMPMRVSTGQVFSHATDVFATDSYSDQAVLSSNLHQLWAITYGSTLETRVRYTPSTVFETFPRPNASVELSNLGMELHETRREVMSQRHLGLTDIYNLINDPNEDDSDIERLRALHVRLDEATWAAYQWDVKFPLGHGFHEYRQAVRWTVSPQAREEILDQLLAENLVRGQSQVIRRKSNKPHNISREPGTLFN